MISKPQFAFAESVFSTLHPPHTDLLRLSTQYNPTHIYESRNWNNAKVVV